MRRTLFLIASILVSALFLWLALRDVPTEEILASLREADLLWILISLALGSIGLYTRGIRWRGLLNNRLTPMAAFHMFSIAQLLNQLPMRAGEVARSALATRSNIPFFTAATSILVERLLDTLFVVIVLSLALTQIPDVPPTITQAAVLFGVAGMIAVVVLLIFARRPEWARHLLSFFERLLPFLKRLPLRGLLENVLDGIQPLARWRSAAHAIFWTIVSWTFSLGTFYTLALALGIHEGNVLMTLLSVTMASFAIALPVSVASIGPFEGAVKISGQAVGISASLSLSLGFLFHGVTILSYAIWGTVGLLMMGVSLSDILKSDKTKPAPDVIQPASSESVGA
jgi:glycosyltransferase 2 family protein